MRQLHTSARQELRSLRYSAVSGRGQTRGIQSGPPSHLGGVVAWMLSGEMQRLLLQARQIQLGDFPLPRVVAANTTATFEICTQLV